VSNSTGKIRKITQIRGIKSFIDDNGVITDLGLNEPNSDQSKARIG